MSHPSDPNYPNKFRKLGGGVFIAIRSNIQADIKRLSVRTGAEIVAIEVTIELELSYSNEVNLRKCKQVNILPLLYRFMFNDMNLFHKVVYKIIPVTMPDYLTLYSGDSRLRSTHFDNLSFVSNIASTTTSISIK